MKSEKALNIGNSLEYRLQEGNWWKNGAECLNMNDIHKPPQYYAGTVKEWIEELTTYIYLYPAEWQSIYEQYKGLSKNESVLKFYRNDEGYLRSTELDVVYLKITGEDEPMGYEVLDCVGQMLSESAEELFNSFLEYAGMEEEGKKCWMERIEKTIQESMAGRVLSVTLAETLDESAFEGNELYFDLLNDLYMIL